MEKELIVYSSDGFEGNIALLDGKMPFVEISFPTARVPNLVRFETESYTLKVKLTKRSLAVWEDIFIQLKALLSETPIKSVVDLGGMCLLVKKNKKPELVMLETSVPLKHLSPGWFKSEEEVATFDFFS